jgi:hypothetical protein
MLYPICVFIAMGFLTSAADPDPGSDAFLTLDPDPDPNPIFFRA